MRSDGLIGLLDEHAPLSPVPLCPELLAFTGIELTRLWEAAERLVGEPVASPFWGYPWPGGVALARTLLDRPGWVRGRTVLDLGCGGGVAALAAGRAGAARVVANDVDSLALAVARLAAERQGLELELRLGDLTAPDAAAESERFEVVLCGDVAYERSVAPRIRAFLDERAARGALVLIADPGRAYFDAAGLEELGRWSFGVPRDVEGVERRTAVAYLLRPSG